MEITMEARGSCSTGTAELLDAVQGGAWWRSTIRSVVSDTLSRWLGPFDGLRLVRIDQAW
jgi:hypothetical protein